MGESLLKPDAHWAIWAVLVGILGYAIANFVGVAVATFLR